MDSYTNLYTYTSLFALSLMIYWYRKRTFDAGFFLIALYMVYALFSISLYYDRTLDFYYFNISLFPLLYLFVCLFIAFSPILLFKPSSYLGIQEPSTKYLEIIAWVIILSCLFQFDYIYHHLTSGITKILYDEDGGRDLYTEMADKAASGGMGISNFFAIIGNMFYNFGILLLFYYLATQEKKKIIIVGLTFVMLIGILNYIAAGQRGGMVKRTLVAIGTYLLFKEYINEKIKKKVRIIGAILVLVIAVLFMAVSNSRFASRSGGVSSSFNRYAGQSVLYFDKYAFDNNGIRYGDRTMPVFKTLLLFDNVPRNYVQRRLKYPQLYINDEVFITFVGDFCLDFGPFMAFVIILFFSLRILFFTRSKQKYFPFHKLIILHLALCICLQGGSLFAYADLGNVEILLYILLCVFFFYDYKNKLNLHCRTLSSK